MSCGELIIGLPFRKSYILNKPEYKFPPYVPRAVCLTVVSLTNSQKVTAVCALLSEGHSAQDEIEVRRIMLVLDTDVLPVVNQSERIVVYLAYTFQSLIELNSKEQSLSVSGNLQLMWKSSLMSWDASDFGGVGRIQVKPSLIWTPDINVRNSVSEQSKIGTDNFLVRIQQDGTVTWYPDASLKTQCSLEAAKFPFDIQKCDFVFETKLYPVERIELLASRSDLLMHLFQQNGEWEVLEHRVKNGSDLNHVVCTIVFKRRLAFHVINTILPILLLSILNVLVFVLPPEAGEKMSLSITVLLAYAVFLSVFNKNMPTISTSVSLLGVYMIITLAIGTGSTFLSAVLLNFYFSKNNSWRRFFVLGNRRSCRETHHHVGNAGNDISTMATTGLADVMSPASAGKCKEYDHRSHVDDSQVYISNKIDILSFWGILFCTITFTVVCLLVMVFGN